MSASVEILQGPASRLEGYLDAVEDGTVFGWAWDRLHPADRLTVEIRVDGKVAASATADRARPDLRHGGIGDGAHAFAVTLEAGAAGFTVDAISPSTGERIELKTRQPEDETALLRRVAGAVDALSLNQRRLGAALREVKPTQDNGEIAKLLAEIRAAQEALAKQQGSMEIFLLRFETLLRDLPAKSAEPKPQPGFWARIFR
ncbi:MAG TPA: hypothetical protein VL974_06255 [Magnetospirillum sp.]|jgi:hypothetical protein|nr:hypothetical protein [Magnetospirillum sp.]